MKEKKKGKHRKAEECYSFQAEQDDLTIYFIRGIIFSSKEREQRRGKKQREKVDK